MAVAASSHANAVILGLKVCSPTDIDTRDIPVTIIDPRLSTCVEAGLGSDHWTWEPTDYGDLYLYTSGKEGNRLPLENNDSDPKSLFIVGASKNFHRKYKPSR